MKENELRLNNLVMVNYKTDLLSKVTWIQEGSINVIFDRQPDLVNGVVCSVNDLIPIKLTPKVLLKFGLIQKSNTFYLWENSVWTLIKWDKNNNGYALYYKDDMVDCELICSAHQLQNLFFSLTGEELVFSTEP